MATIVARGGALLTMLVFASGCGGSDAPAASKTASVVFDSVIAAAAPGQWRASGTDVVEVWICHVPDDSTASDYGGLPLRMPIAAAPLAALFQQQVFRYFDRVSHGVYTPSFVAGGDVVMAANDGPEQCVDAAIAKAGSTANVVLAVADAEQVPPAHGGLGSGGVVTTRREPVQRTRRYAYVGAADFDRATWGDNPPLDLVEHELGHTLGWVHSGVSRDGQYLSALDLMSNSAAPRDTEPTRRDAPDVLALHRVMAGWIPASDVTVAIGPTTVTLSPGNGTKGKRLLVLPVDDTKFLTVELVSNDGYDDHLPASGVTVHRVTVDRGEVTEFLPILGNSPFTDVLQPGASVVSDGWRVEAGPDGRVVATAGF